MYCCIATCGRLDFKGPLKAKQDCTNGMQKYYYILPSAIHTVNEESFTELNFCSLCGLSEKRKSYSYESLPKV